MRTPRQGFGVFQENEKQKLGSLVWREITHTDEHTHTSVLGKVPNPCDLVCRHRVYDEGEIEIWEGASLVKAKRPPNSKFKLNGPSGGGRRGRVRGFSKASRWRMLQTVAKVRNDQVPLFLTLTYPADFPFDSATWKRHLDNFFKRLRRKCPGAAAIWKLEPQKRGAPHFHLLVWGVELFAFDAWVHTAWYEIVDSGDIKHIVHGAELERLRSYRGAKSYAAKYMGKLQDDIEGWEFPGRWWGVFAADNIPWGDCVRVGLPRAEAIIFLRTMRRYARIKRRDFSSLTILCNSASWWRVNLPKLLYQE